MTSTTHQEGIKCIFITNTGRRRDRREVKGCGLLPLWMGKGLESGAGAMTSQLGASQTLSHACRAGAPKCTSSVPSCPVLHRRPGWPVGGDSAFLRAQRVQKPKNRRSDFTTTRSASKSCSWYTQYHKEVFLYLYILYMYNLYRNFVLWKH